MNNNDTSSISFTAHYTGYVWYKNRLSNQTFATKQGFAYYQMLRPIEVLAKRFIGSDIKTTLLQRHQLLDRELINLIHQHPDLQVLELACGLSPRGWRINKKYPYIHYVEADLAGMAQQKHSLLQRLDSLNQTHKVTVCNILQQDTPESLESLLKREFNPEKPIVVMTEGLVNYFTLEQISQFWNRLATGLKDFPAGFYLTDVYPKVTQHRFYHWIQFANKTLKMSSRSSFSMHFEKRTEATHCLQHCGFQQVSVFNPDEELHGRPKTRGGALVWVIRCEV